MVLQERMYPPTGQHRNKAVNHHIVQHHVKECRHCMYLGNSPCDLALRRQLSLEDLIRMMVRLDSDQGQEREHHQNLKDHLLRTDTGQIPGKEFHRRDCILRTEQHHTCHIHVSICLHLNCTCTPHTTLTPLRTPLSTIIAHLPKLIWMVLTDRFLICIHWPPHRVRYTHVSDQTMHLTHITRRPAIIIHHHYLVLIMHCLVNKQNPLIQVIVCQMARKLIMYNLISGSHDQPPRPKVPQRPGSPVTHL